MKYRIVSIVAVLLMLLSFVSCDKGTKEFVLSQFNSVVSFECNGADFIGNLEYASADNICLTMSSPEHMKGIKIVRNGNKTNISCDDLTVPLENIKSDMDIYTPLFSALASLTTSDVKIKKDGTDTVVLGENSDIRIKILSSEMQILSVENCGYTYNFQYN